LTIMLRRSAVFIAAGICSASSAQTGSLAAPKTRPEASQAGNVPCLNAAVFSAGAGPEVHVTRLGTLDQRDPLAPLTKAKPARIIEVRIRDKLAAAYGPSFQELRRAAAPPDLERGLGNSIQWEPNLAALPRTLSIVGELPGEVVAILKFIRCAGTEKPSARPRPAKEKPNSKPPVDVKPSRPLPRGTLE
jgi:hypothetical protein